MTITPGAQKPRTVVYVDALNFYYRYLKDTAYKWLNLEELFGAILPNNDVIEIKYFTSHVSSHVDPLAPARQKIYLDALSTFEKVKIITGFFITSHKFMKIAESNNGSFEFRPENHECKIIPPPLLVKVIKCEEKESDVNLASHILSDGFRGRFDVAVLVSTDTDFSEPLRIIKEELRLKVGLICSKRARCASLKQHAHFVKHIRPDHLKAAQLPNPILIGSKQLRKPSTW
jgi:NYN domain